MIDQSSYLGPLSRRTKDESEDDFKTRMLALLGDTGAGGPGGSFPVGSSAQRTFRLPSAAASTNATSVKASAGDVFKITGFNANAAARYLKLYNKASAPTVGTDAPIWTEYLPAQEKFSIDFDAAPLHFTLGIAYALTTGVADADTGALTAADVLALNGSYA